MDFLLIIFFMVNGLGIIYFYIDLFKRYRDIQLFLNDLDSRLYDVEQFVFFKLPDEEWFK